MARVGYKRWKEYIDYIKNVRVELDGNSYNVVAIFAQGGYNGIATFPFERGNKREQLIAQKMAQDYAQRIKKAGEYIKNRLK